MLQLNLPAAPLRLAKHGERTLVFDPLRRRYITLTPEEWVRRHLIAYL